MFNVERVKLNMFNAELSPKRYWRQPRSQEVCVCGGGGGILYRPDDTTDTVTTRMTPALRREAMRAVLMFH